jgi:hypothetical protein
MANVDLNGAISSLVASEVERVLQPYRGLLDRMAEFAGVSTVVKRGPGRPPASVAAVVRRPRRVVREMGGDASDFREGQAVQYKQGRGIFDATVLSVSVESGMLMLQRSKDGKKVERPASKVYGV